MSIKSIIEERKEKSWKAYLLVMGVLLLIVLFELSFWGVNLFLKSKYIPESIIVSLLIVILLTILVLLIINYIRLKNNDKIMFLLIRDALQSIHSEISNDARIERELASKMESPRENNIRAESMQKAADVVSRYLDIYKNHYFNNKL